MSEQVQVNHRTDNHRLKILGACLSLGMLCVALWFLHHELAGITRNQVIADIKAIPLTALLMAIGFAACSYLILTAYDALALRYLKRDIPYWQSGTTAFMAYAVGHNVGVAALSGGSIRYRMYSQMGLPTTEIAAIVAFTTLTFVLGAATLLGVAMLLLPPDQLATLKLAGAEITGLGTLLCAIPLFYVFFCSVRREPFKFRSWQLPLPDGGTALQQLAIGAAELTFAAATLYVLLAPQLDISFFAFLGIYLVAMGAGVISSVPGGIGVFEAILLAALPNIQSTAALGTIVVFRLIYYIAPLVVALLLLVRHESKSHEDHLRRAAGSIGNWLSAIAPQVSAAIAFLAGFILLISGATPAINTRLNLIAQHIPSAVLEASHLISSLLGLALLILAQGLHRRLHKAFLATLAVLAIGALVSLLKGLDYEEAIVLTLVGTILWTARKAFYRRGALATRRITTPWTAAIVGALCMTIWVMLFTVKHSTHADLSWWQFTFSTDAPPVVRAGILVVVAAFGFVLWNLLRRGSTGPDKIPLQEQLNRLKPVLANGQDTNANLVLLGDKRVLWSADERAFLMYQISGNSWISMGDPVGDCEAWPELLWEFRELVDQHNGRAVFYQVRDTSLSLYADVGLTVVKLGEDAKVPLADFSLQGSHRSALRQAHNRGQKLGATFEVIPKESVAAILPELRRISDAWLVEKATAEKSFSLGAFSEEYVAQFDCGVVRVGGKIVAFVNLWTAPAGKELSIDLMRYDQNAPKGVMDYMFVELMLWGRARQYLWFSLGMAPLSGLEQHALAPTWHKLGYLIYTHGEDFYNFDGLRKYKDKYHPTWRARYMACPAGWLNISKALLDTASLVSGGVVGLVSK